MQQILLEQTTTDNITACWTHVQHQSMVEHAVASSMPASARTTHYFGGLDVSTTDRMQEILEQYDSYIYALAWKHIREAYVWVCSALLEDKVNELAQRSRIKFWHALQQNQINTPKAYIRRIVCTELIDTLRQQKRVQVGPLSLTEEGELYHDHGRLLVERSEGMNDPAFEAEEHETTDHYISAVVAAVIELPPRQQEAMFCLLKDKFGNFQPLTETCKKWNIDLGAIAWPAGEDERHKLKACVAPAKKKVHVLIREL